MGKKIKKSGKKMKKPKNLTVQVAAPWFLAGWSWGLAWRRPWRTPGGIWCLASGWWPKPGGTRSAEPGRRELEFGAGRCSRPVVWLTLLPGLVLGLSLPSPPPFEATRKEKGERKSLNLRDRVEGPTIDVQWAPPCDRVGEI